MLARITKTFARQFCTSQSVQPAQPSSIVEPNKSSEVPVYLKPYDKSRYEVPMTKIKLNSGYSFLEIEPFPRAKIMKICYHIMEQLTIGFPQTSIYRIYNEERTKYIMKIVDETTDIEELQDFFGVETIELFLDNLTGHLETIGLMRHYKVWEKQTDDSIQSDYMDDIVSPQQQKTPLYKKSERSKSSFIQE